jgi:transcriptional regulator with XRE-family HTH domain
MRVDTGRLRVVAAEAVSPEPQHEGRARSRSDRKGERRKEPAPEDLGASEGADGYDSPGPYIKAQRRRRGMSLEQLAATTKIPRAQLELIEADRYEELPGMVFAKGFLRCCARSLELDPDTVLGLLYERERAQLRKRRREAGATSEPAAKIPRGAKRGAASPARRPRASGGVDQVRAWAVEILGRLPSARIVMWLLVALFVALVVFIAFTLASGQSESLMIRS